MNESLQPSEAWLKFSVKYVLVVLEYVPLQLKIIQLTFMICLHTVLTQSTILEIKLHFHDGGKLFLWFLVIVSMEAI